MPSSVYPDELAKMLLANCPKAGLVERVWPRLQPLIRRAYTDTYPLKDATTFDPEQVRKALADGFQTKVDAVKFLSVSAEGALKDVHMNDMINHVAEALTANRDHAFRVLMTHKEGERFRKSFFEELGNPLMDAFFAEHWPAFMGGNDLETHMLIMSTPTFYLFFLLGHLFAGDEADVDAMLPLAELLTSAVPVGETFDELGTWIVLTK